MAKTQVEPIVIGPARIAFPSIATANDKGKYAATILLDKADAQCRKAIQDIRKLLHAQAVASWGENKSDWPARFKNVSFKNHVSPDGRDGFPLRDGDDVEWDGFAGCFFSRASSLYQPGVVNARLTQVMNIDTDLCAGMLCKFQINAYTYNKEGNQGLGLGLLNIQIVKDDGVRFGGGAHRAEDVFDALEEDDDLSSENPENYATKTDSDPNEDW